MKQTKKKSKCIGCGKQFTVNARNQHYCSVNSCAEHGKKRIEVVWMNYQKGQMTLKDYVTRGQL